MQNLTLSQETLMLELLEDDGNAERLLELERRIARRADEISAGNPSDRDRDLSCWLLAESEILS